MTDDWSNIEWRQFCCMLQHGAVNKCHFYSKRTVKEPNLKIQNIFNERYGSVLLLLFLFIQYLYRGFGLSKVLTARCI